MTDLYDLTLDLVRLASSRLIKRYAEYVEAGDIEQTIWVWVYSDTNHRNGTTTTNEAWIREQLEGGADGRPLPYGVKDVTRQLYRIGLRFCRREKAAISGYETKDEFYYSRGMLEEILPHVWSTGVLDVEKDPTRPSTKKDPAEGGDLAAMVQDARYAYYELSISQQTLLERRYRFGMSVKDMALYEECAESTLYERIKRVLNAMVENLGGSSAEPRRGED